ncbi:MAG: hypothetical protein H6581_14640 [Bacteroidia bacterium]|nr:hypothetical protein [Bacteroidia bacterium]
MAFFTANFIPILFSVIFGGMALLGISLNLFARQKRLLQLMHEAVEKNEDPSLVQVKLFPFILRLSSLAYVFNAVPNYEEFPKLYEHPAIQKVALRIGAFTRFYMFAFPLAFLTLLALMILAAFAG